MDLLPNLPSETTNEETEMSVRSSEIYVSPKTARRLRWIAETIKVKTMDGSVTADSLADQALNAWVEQNHPSILEVEKIWENGIAKLRSECDKQLNI